MKVSLVFTVLNESASLPALLDSIAAQTRLPDEVVACDGGSADETVRLLRAETRFPVRVIVAPGANISQGRNQAIAVAQHDLVACTDAGVRLDPRWLENLIRPIDDFRFTIDDSQLPIPPIQNPKSKIQNPPWRGLWRAGLCARCDCLVPPAHLARFILQAVLPICARRRQGESMAQAPPGALRDISCFVAGTAGRHPVWDAASFTGAMRGIARAGRSGLSARALSPAAPFVAVAVCRRQGEGRTVDTHHPRDRRHCQDGRLPCRPALATAPQTIDDWKLTLEPGDEVVRRRTRTVS